MPAKEIVSALNGNLPDDIAILKAEDVGENFHAQFDAKQKTYRYVILHRRIRGVMKRKYSWQYPYKLNLTLLKKETKY